MNLAIDMIGFKCVWCSHIFTFGGAVAVLGMISSKVVEAVEMLITRCGGNKCGAFTH